MAEVIWAEAALADLNEIAEYIALSNRPAAKRLIKNIFAHISRLERFPQSGRIMPEFNDLPYREVLVNPCRILYKIDSDTVYILHVARQERAMRNYLLNSGVEIRV